MSKTCKIQELNEGREYNRTCDQCGANGSCYYGRIPTITKSPEPMPIIANVMAALQPPTAPLPPPTAPLPPPTAPLPPPTPILKRGEILDAVKKTITQDRNNRHGEPENSFPRIAEVWGGYIWRKLGIKVDLKPSDVAEMLADFKGVRFEIQPDNPENEHDRIGYLAIAAELRSIERSAQFEPAAPSKRPLREGEKMQQTVLGKVYEYTAVAFGNDLLWQRTG